MFQFGGDLAQVKFYQNNTGRIFVKLNDGTMIDGVIWISFFSILQLLYLFMNLCFFLLVSGTTGTKRHHHHSSKTNKIAVAAAIANNEAG
jgi:hypothetical protein